VECQGGRSGKEKANKYGKGRREATQMRGMITSYTALVIFDWPSKTGTVQMDDVTTRENSKGWKEKE
jgi:hypothetical protein